MHEQEIIISTSKIKVIGLLTLSLVFFNASLISVLYFAKGQDLEDLILSWVFLVIFGFSCIVGSASLFREGVPKLRISEEKLMFEQGLVFHEAQGAAGCICLSMHRVGVTNSRIDSLPSRQTVK